jgi:hypothetical protein
MTLRIINENPTYPLAKLIEPTAFGYIRLAAVVQPPRIPILSTRLATRQVFWETVFL